VLAEATAGTGAQGASAPLEVVDVVGHGFGDGYGMGQWGAFGDAVEFHDDAAAILSQFYGGAALVRTGATAPVLSVAITANAGRPVAVTSGSPFRFGGVSVPGGDLAVASLVDPASGTWSIAVGPGGCGASSLRVAGTAVDPVALPASSGASATPSQVLGLCEAGGGEELLRGEIEADDHDGGARTLNLVGLEEYLDGVVPAEVPALWGAVGGTSGAPGGEAWGFQALEAQAIAARSYALAYSRHGWHGYADICDSTACQAYLGLSVEATLTDLAVADTAGEVLEEGGEPLLALYGSSTGGYSAGGPFPAVADPGDAVCLPGPDDTCNPFHDWQATLSATAVLAAFPGVGSALRAVTVLERNGLGDLGGRVLEVEVVGNAAVATTTGTAFADALGLPSDWFAVTDDPGGDAGGLSGYWLAAADGAVAPFGAAVAYGSASGVHLAAPIVGIAATPDGKGYWLAGADGGVFAFGDAGFHGSVPGALAAECVAHGLAPGCPQYRLAAPIVGIAATPDGKGYWLAGADGGVFAFGDAPFLGAGLGSGGPVTALQGVPSGDGYLLVTALGAVVPFFDAPQYGDLVSRPDGDASRVVAVAGLAGPSGA
jgi:peptidoglycan hydrolase-like amidase